MASNLNRKLVAGFRLNYADSDYDGLVHLERELNDTEVKALFLEAKAKGQADFEDGRKKYVITHHEKRGFFTNQEEYTLIERQDEEGGLGVLGL